MPYLKCGNITITSECLLRSRATKKEREDGERKRSSSVKCRNSASNVTTFLIERSRERERRARCDAEARPRKSHVKLAAGSKELGNHVATLSMAPAEMGKSWKTPRFLLTPALADDRNAKKRWKGRKPARKRKRRAKLSASELVCFLSGRKSIRNGIEFFSPRDPLLRGDGNSLDGWTNDSLRGEWNAREKEQESNGKWITLHFYAEANFTGGNIVLVAATPFEK